MTKNIQTCQKSGAFCPFVRAKSLHLISTLVTGLSRVRSDVILCESLNVNVAYQL